MMIVRPSKIEMDTPDTVRTTMYRVFSIFNAQEQQSILAENILVVEIKVDRSITATIE